MATLVLSTIGTVAGGPIGGALGALLGQQVDRQMFGPRGRQGPRLGDLAVQTSHYGQAIPKIFGTMRVAGTVIWATDLREEPATAGGGKGRPEITTYSYSASFAVALSSRPIRAVGRIWADGKLLRGAAGDWKSSSGFRLYFGDEDQPLDPLIASAEGIDSTPAYRGIAYALFEDLQLADFGNRIPSLTFEVMADQDAPSIGGIVEELAGGNVAASAGAELTGYAASGDSVRGATEALASAAALTLRDEGDRLALRRDVGVARVLETTALGASLGERKPRTEVERQSSATLPDALILSYYEPGRDFQSSVQRARRSASARRVERMELPVALDAPGAKARVEDMLEVRWVERSRAIVRVPWRYLDCRPGMVVRLGQDPVRWRVTEASIGRMAVELSLVALDDPALPSGAGSPGRATLAPDLVHGPTTLVLLDLPPLSDVPGTEPHIWVAAAGASPGWRRAALMTSRDNGASWQAAGRTAAPAVIGHAATALATGDSSLFDAVSTVEVELLHTAMLLQSCSDDALVDGANAAMLGAELIQFGQAVPLDGNRWRLARLLRGRRGTEDAQSGHAVGEPFVLLDNVALTPLVQPQAAIGGQLSVTGIGVGDGPEPPRHTIDIGGRALRPPSPVHLSARRHPDGTIRITWVRRSRIGWTWLSGQDAPVGEEGERYRLRLQCPPGAPREVEVDAPSYEYPASLQVEDGVSNPDTIVIWVEQLGALASSPPATASLNL